MKDAARDAVTEQDLEVWAEELSQAQLECRELGHAWRPRTAAWNSDVGVYDRTLQCSRCKTQRIETLSERGEILSRRYAYPDGYISKELGRITGTGRDVLRREALLRQLDKTA